VIVDHALEDSTSSIPSNLCGPVAQLPMNQLNDRRTCNCEVEISTFSRSTRFGFVAQKVERHVEGVSVAVSKSAEATKLSARSLAWLEALALGAR